jgi:hypothetical protein
LWFLPPPYFRLLPLALKVLILMLARILEKRIDLRVIEQLPFSIVCSTYLDKILLLLGHCRRQLKLINYSRKIALTTVVGFVRFIGTIRTDITNAVIRYACHVVRTQEMRVGWTTTVGYASKIF